MSDSDRHLFREIKRVDNCIKRSLACECKSDSDEEITSSNCWLIMYLYDHRNGDVFQKDIEAEFAIRRSTSSKIISLMEKKGYVERVSVEHDARLKKLVLTQKALQQCDIITSNVEEFERKIAKDITPQELETFYVVLDKIMNNIGS